MSGQLVIAELGAFKTILRNAKPADCEKVKSWCRSTITNALHRVGPTELMKTASEQASTEADFFAAALLSHDGCEHAREQARQRALDSLDGLIAAVRGSKVGLDIDRAEPMLKTS